MTQCENLLNYFLNRWATDRLYKDDYLLELNSIKVTTKEALEVKDILVKFAEKKHDEIREQTNRQIFASHLDKDASITLVFELFINIYISIELENSNKIRNSIESKRHEYLASCRNINELLYKSKEKKYYWIPEFLIGYLFENNPKEREFSVLRYIEALHLAEGNYTDIAIAKVSNFLGLQYYERGLFEDCKKTYLDAIKKWPKSIYLLNNLAFLMIIIEDSNTLAILDRAINTFPKDPYINFNYACYILKNRDNCNDRLHEVVQKMDIAYKGFREEYENHRLRSIILDIFNCGLLTDLSYHYATYHHDKTFIENSEEVAKGLMIHLLADISNFLTEKLEKQEKFYDFFARKRTIDNLDHLAILKRWNSYTPLIPPMNTDRTGGGYFLSWKGIGIVIDPGPGFCLNFSNSNYSLSDIDVIVISHGHIDHTEEFERILTLLHEQRRMLNYDSYRKISLILSPGAFAKYSALITRSGDVIQDCLIAYPERTIKLDEKPFEIRTITANHQELFSKSDNCLCFIFDLMDEEKVKYTIGFTNDTSYIPKDIKTFFTKKDLDILVMNVGSLSLSRLIYMAKIKMPDTWKDDFESKMLREILDKKDVLKSLGYEEYSELISNCFNEKKDSQYEWYNKHLGFRGLYELVKEKKSKYYVISEFGEEIKNHRHMIAKTFNEHFFDKKNRVMTGDLNTKFRFLDGKTLIWCDICNGYVENQCIEKIIKNEDYRILRFCDKPADNMHKMVNILKRYGALI